LDYAKETAALSRADLAQVIIERWSNRRSVGTVSRCYRRLKILLNTFQTWKARYLAPSPVGSLLTFLPRRSKHSSALSRPDDRKATSFQELLCCFAEHQLAQKNTLLFTQRYINTEYFDSRFALHTPHDLFPTVLNSDSLQIWSPPTRRTRPLLHVPKT
jgi:hypothetical protein